MFIMNEYNRYSKFTEEGVVKFVPFVNISYKSTDKYVEYNSKKHRMDRLSYEYYGNPNYGWLIMQANPSLGALEFKIKDGDLVRIPYPLDETIQNYIENIDLYNTLN